MSSSIAGFGTNRTITSTHSRDERQFSISHHADSIIPTSVYVKSHGGELLALDKDVLIQALRDLKIIDEPRPAEVERKRSYFPSEEFVQEAGTLGEYLVGDRMGESHHEGGEPVTIKTGLLGDNIVIKRDDFKFTLGLASIEAIVKKHSLKPGPELEIQAKPEPKPEWLKAEVISAIYEGEKVVLRRDFEDDFEVLSGADQGGYVYAADAEDALTDVEIVIGA